MASETVRRAGVILLLLRPSPCLLGHKTVTIGGDGGKAGQTNSVGPVFNR